MDQARVNHWLAIFSFWFHATNFNEITIAPEAVVISKRWSIYRFRATVEPFFRAGFLVNGRHGHGAIFDGQKFLIIGGYIDGDPVMNEVCSLQDSRMICIEQPIDMEGYYEFPELFLVAEDFSKNSAKCWKLPFCKLFIWSWENKISG